MAMKVAPWVGRSFRFDLAVELFPCLLERLRGTPARLEELVATFPDQLLHQRQGDAWSVLEHAGHLWDLEELGERRLAEYLAGAEVLTAADMENRKTWEADYNSRPAAEVLQGFRQARMRFVEKLDRLDAAAAGRAALHPRLKQAMRIVDWVFFMAEHDDHHLARIRESAPSLT